MKNLKRLENVVTIVLCLMILLIPISVTNAKEANKEVTVSNQEELLEVLKNSTDLKKITIKTDQEEQFILYGSVYPNYPNLEIIFDAPKSEMYNAATLKSINIISGSVWFECGLNNTIDISALKCHVILDSHINPTIININKEFSTVWVDCKSPATINVNQPSTKLNISGGDNLATVNVYAKDTTLNVDVITNINLRVDTPLTIKNNSGHPLNVTTPWGIDSISKDTTRTIRKISFRKDSSGNSDLTSNNDSTWQPEQLERPIISVNPIIPVQPGITIKPVKPDVPTIPGKPENPTKPWKPGKPEKPVECKHEYGDWQYSADLDADVAVCELCGKEMTREHIHTAPPSILAFKFLASNNDGTHTLTADYFCSICNQVVTVKKVATCIMGDEDTSYIQSNVGKDTHTKVTSQKCSICNYETSSSEEEACSEDWKYSAEKGMEISECVCGAEKVREHIHTDPPSELEFEFLKSNNDGTHNVQAKYICTACNEELSVDKVESCAMGEPVVQRNPKFNFDHTHVLESTCSVCGYKVQEEESCTIDTSKGNSYGVIEGILSLCQTCTVCQGDVYTVHNTHTIPDEWTSHDDETHRRECECGHISGRIEENHTFGEYDSQGSFSCTKCGYVKTVAQHNHGYGFANLHGDKNLMWEIVLNQNASAERITDSPVDNPNPSSGDYCYRFDFRCHTCGVGYSAYVDHAITDGVCSRCGYTEPITVAILDVVDNILISDGTSEGTTSEDTTSKSTTSEGTTSKGTTSEGTTSEDTTSEGTTSEDTTSEDTTSEDTTSEGTTSKGTTSEGTTSKGTTSKGTTSKGTTSKGTASEDTTSKGTASEDTTSTIK